MISIICPECKGHISEWDVICLRCGHSVTPEERATLVKEQEDLIAREHAERTMAHHRMNSHRHSFQVKMDRLSVGLLHVTLDVVFVIFISVVLGALFLVLTLL